MRMLVLPDNQVRPDVNLSYLGWIGEFIKEHRFDAIEHLGDFADMKCLSSYDAGKKAAEGVRFTRDWNAIDRGFDLLTKPWRGIKAYKPLLNINEGNHDGSETSRGSRMHRYIENHAELAGTLRQPLAPFEKHGWTVHKFLRPHKVGGVTFSHFFPRTARGTISAASSRHGANSAYNQVKANMTSCVAGHKQGLDSCIYNVGTRRYRSIIAGSCYLHNEPYLGHQGNDYWRGCLILNNVRNGDFDLTEVSLDYLKRKYG